MDYSKPPLTQQETLMDDPTPQKRAGELEIAIVTAIHTDGSVEVNSARCEKNELAISTVAISTADVGRQVAIMRIEKPQHQAVIIGLIRSSVDRLLDIIDVADPEDDQGILQDTPPKDAHSHAHNTSVNKVDKPAHDQAAPSQANTLNVDGEKVLITGDKEIVLQCGDASITLRKDGKIVIRGQSILNRATGVNRIMGGSVKVN